jgi:hypothetical protein
MYITVKRNVCCWQIQALTSKQAECEKYLTEVKQAFTQSQLQLQDQLVSQLSLFRLCCIIWVVLYSWPEM